MNPEEVGRSSPEGERNWPFPLRISVVGVLVSSAEPPRHPADQPLQFSPTDWRSVRGSTSNLEMIVTKALLEELVELPSPLAEMKTQLAEGVAVEEEMVDLRPRDAASSEMDRPRMGEGAWVAPNAGLRLASSSCALGALQGFPAKALRSSSLSHHSSCDW